MKIGHFGSLEISEEMQATLENRPIFGGIGKPIALLFDENWPILVAWRFVTRDAITLEISANFGHQKVSL